jgi:hypothetical protein
MMRTSILAGMLFVSGTVVCAQNGGKAEPKRIIFEPRTSESLLTGSLKNGEEMEFVFAGIKGRKVILRNSAVSMFDVRVFSEEFGLETEFDSSREFSVTLPETGDYMLFVRKKMVRMPARSRFNVAIRIR